MGDPGFTFYADNFLGGTLFFSDEQVGRYMRALCAQKFNGHLTLDQLNVFIKNDPAILSKFAVDDDGLYYNIRLEKEIIKRELFSEIQKKRIEKRWRKKDTPVIPGYYPGITPVIPGSGITSLKVIPDNATESLKGDMVKKEEKRMQGERKEEKEKREGSDITVNHGETCDVPGDPPELPYRECSVLLRDRILERRQQKITDETLEKWDREVRLMVQRDNRTIEDILALINECHDMEPRPGSDFTWRDNVLSMEALRKRWNEGKIYIGMNKKTGPKSYRDLQREREYPEDMDNLPIIRVGKTNG